MLPRQPIRDWTKIELERLCERARRDLDRMERRSQQRRRIVAAVNASLPGRVFAWIKALVRRLGRAINR